MEMDVKIFNTFTTSKWSGGETTELFIYPGDAQYKKRDFLFRISRATIPKEKSSFTKLPGVDRKLLLLSGETKLSFPVTEQILSIDEQVTFDGDWDTTSEGEATDFNLMLQNGAQGSVEPIYLLPGDREICGIFLKERSKCFVCLYLCEGNLVIRDGYGMRNILEGELGVLEIPGDYRVQGVTLENNSDKKVKLVKTVVYVEQ